MASEPDKNMSEIWLKLWTFKETGVERLPIMRFGATVKHDSTLRGSYLLRIRHGEGGILSCLLHDLLHLLAKHGHPEGIGSLPHNTFSPSPNPSPIFFQWKPVFGKFAHSCQQVVDYLSSKEDQLHIVHHQSDRNCILLLDGSLMLLMIYDPNIIQLPEAF